MESRNRDRVQLSLGRKTFYVIVVLYLIILSIYSTIVIVADNYSTAESDVTFVGIAVNVTQDVAEGYAFDIIFEDENGQVKSEPATSPPEIVVTENDVIVYYTVIDSVYVPEIYNKRVWLFRTVGENIILDTEPHKPMRFVYGVWFGTVIVSALRLFGGRTIRAIKKGIKE